MKFVFTLLAILICCQMASAQILCISCYNQNAGLATVFTNQVLNGGFEQNNCIANAYTSSYCPNSQYFSCTLNNWICTGGGTSTYTSIDDNTFCVTPEGTQAAYLGNGSYASACSTTFNDTSCLSVTDCQVLSIPIHYPTNTIDYGDTTGVSIEQTISNLTIGNTYVLEFWAGGEPQSHGWTKDGVFAVDLGFGKTFFRCKPTDIGYTGDRFLIVFQATATSHTIRFTNWGHICIPCTEVILDDVRFYNYEELPAAYRCITNTFTIPNNNIAVIENNNVFQFLNLNQNEKIVVMNELGQNMAEEFSSIYNDSSIDLSDYPSGIYFYHIISNNSVIANGKLLKH